MLIEVVTLSQHRAGAAEECEYCRYPKLLFLQANETERQDFEQSTKVNYIL